MATDPKTVRVIPYGRLDQMGILFQKKASSPLQISKIWNRLQENHELWQLLIAFSDELDDGFVTFFRERATPETKLLVLNDGKSSDKILSRIIDLKIRTAERFYVADPYTFHGHEKTWEDMVCTLLSRLTAALKSKRSRNCIFDARVDDGALHVVSAAFQRLEVPLSKIGFSYDDLIHAEDFEIDEDGSYIYWPALDRHLGWEQLEQAINPIAANKAKQKNINFNKRYGLAIQQLRSRKGLSHLDISGLSSKQLKRIENGECRLTAKAAQALAHSHNMTVNEYLQSLASLLK